MLKLPAFKHFQFEDGRAVTVYQDDAKFWRFYLLADFPQVRVLETGEPVFLLTEYKFSDQSREENPDLPRGGGYLVFDAELRVEKTDYDTIVEELQSWVEGEWERLKQGPDDRIRTLKYNSVMKDTLGAHWGNAGHHGGARANERVESETSLTMPGTGEAPPPMDAEAPTVEIGEPLWTEGVVKMNAPSAPGLVNGVIGERKASLVGNNVAAFSLDLLPDGATLMRKTLVNEDGSGATNLTLIQVEYNLKMLAKLPPARLYIKFNTASVYHAMQELFHEHDSSGCDDDYFTSETMMSTAIEAGLLTVKVDMGGITDEDLQETLISQAMQQTRQLLTDRFAKKERAPMEEWADEDVQNSGREIYRLKRVQEVDMTDFEMDMAIEPTIEYEVAPQGTLATFLRDEDMSPYVRTVDLDDDFFKTLSLSARAFANWADDDVAFVELHVEYGDLGNSSTFGTGENLKTQSFTFTPEDTEPKKWDPALIDGNRQFRYRWRVGFEGREPTEWVNEGLTTTRNLNVSVETPGKLDVEVTGVGLDFANVIDAVLVHMTYGTGSDRIANSVLLTADSVSDRWSQVLYRDYDEAISYEVEYLLKTGKTIKSQHLTDGPTQNILVPRPDIDVLDVTLLPAGNWNNVIQAVASLRYSDADNSYHADAQYLFKGAREFKKWAVLQLNPDYKEFEYKVLATFENGDTQETDWMPRQGDEAVPVRIEGPPRLEVKVTGAVLDYASTTLVKIDLRYEDADGDISDLASYSLQKPEDVYTWSVPIREDGPRNYFHKITYYPVQGDPVERDEVETDTELIVVPRYSIPKVGADFNPVLQNFAITPAIEVNLTYDDEERGVSERMTLVFTEKQRQSWHIPVADEAPRGYVMTITWFYPDGASAESTPVTLEKPSVLLPPAPPQEIG